VALPLAKPPTKRENNRIRAASRLSPAPQLLHLWHLASFDAPTVAVVWAFAFARTAGIHLQPWIAPLLFSGTWSVYVGDRLLDAYRAVHSGQLGTLRERHYFHWRYRHNLIPLAACSAVVAAILIGHLMPLVIRERNSVLAAAALMYFSGVHSPSRLPACLRKAGLKELVVGILFTAGCVAPTISEMHFVAIRMKAVWPLFLCFAYFALLAWCNCRAIDKWESASADNVIFLHAGLLTIAGMAISATLAFAHPNLCALAISGTASSLLLLLLDRMRLRLSPLRLRVLADLVLLTPAVLLMFEAYSA
jgi:hypothetical protein